MSEKLNDVKPGSNSSFEVNVGDALSNLQKDVNSKKTLDDHVETMVDALVSKDKDKEKADKDVKEKKIKTGASADDEEDDQDKEKHVEGQEDSDEEDEKGKEKSRSKKEQDEEDEEEGDGEKDVEGDDEEDKESDDESEEDREETEDNDEDEDSDENENGEDEEDDEDKSDKDKSKHESSVPYKRFEKVNRELRETAPLAKAHQSTVDFCKRNRISPQQYREALNIQAMINSDPVKALERLEPLLDHLRVAAGKGLPTDLQKELNEASVEVTEGTMSKARYESLEKRLKETAELRVKEQRSRQAAESSDEDRQQVDQRRITETFTNWIRSKQRLNPSFKDGSPLTEDFLNKYNRLVNEQNPDGVEGMLTLLEEAYTYAKKRNGGGGGSGKNGNGKDTNGKHFIKKKVLSSDRSTSGRAVKETAPRSVDDVMKAVGKKHGFAV